MKNAGSYQILQTHLAPGVGGVHLHHVISQLLGDQVGCGGLTHPGGATEQGTLGPGSVVIADSPGRGLRSGLLAPRVEVVLVPVCQPALQLVHVGLLALLAYDGLAGAGFVFVNKQLRFSGPNIRSHGWDRLGYLRLNFGNLGNLGSFSIDLGTFFSFHRGG